MELYYGIIFWDNVMELYYGIILQNYITGSYYRIIFRNDIMELYYGIIFMEGTPGMPGTSLELPWDPRDPLGTPLGPPGTPL